MPPSAIEQVIQAANVRLNKGTGDTRDAVMVALYSALEIEIAKAKKIREELDNERAVNAQSASTIAIMTTRLASRSASLH